VGFLLLDSVKDSAGAEEGKMARLARLYKPKKSREIEFQRGRKGKGE
jgi:hypothetical protein